MIRYVAASVLVLPLLAGCDRQPAVPANAAAPADRAAAARPEGGFAASIRALPARQRDGVFLRAIRDSKEDCQQVTNEYEIAAVRGNDAWAVTCDRTNYWVISIDPTGTAIVTKASPASRLPPKAG